MSNASTTLFGRRFWSCACGSAQTLGLRGTTITTAAAKNTCLKASQPAVGPSYTRANTFRRSIHSGPQHSFPRPNIHNARRSYTGSGLLLVGFTTNLAPTQATAACAVAAESATSSGLTKKSNVYQLARQAWRRGIHSDSRDVGPAETRHHSSKSGKQEEKSTTTQPKQDAPKPGEQGKSDVPDPDAESIASAMSKYLHIPKMPHRPTRDELLAAANGFLGRMKVRFKWVSIRSMRPWNIDEWGAFVSWFLFGHLVWVLVGTTTFFSLIIFSINTVFAQETLAKWVGDSLTESAGVTVIFESAIVPKWGDGVISFKNVFVSRRPGQVTSSVSKGSSESAAAMAATGKQTDQDGQVLEEDDGNYTQYDLTIATVNVTLSFLKWWNGKGFLKDVEVKGVRGVVDRTSVQWSDEVVDPLSYRHTHEPGDFEIDSFKLEDLLVTVHQPKGFRPFSVSIYSCELPQLRKQWLFYDFLSATHMSGSFDGSLFTIHPRQVHGTIAGENGDVAEDVGEPSAWKKFSRLRIDGLKIDHLNRGVEGPFGWIYEGNVDIVADVMFPADIDDGITKVMSDFYDQLEDVVISNRMRLLQKDLLATTASDLLGPTPTEGHLSHAAPEAAGDQAQQSPDTSDSSDSSDEDRRYLIMDLRIHMNDVKAAVPLFTKDISYINQALVRPIVAYINAKKTYIPITCRIVKRATDFDGSWSIFDCGLMDDMSAETYEAFARDIEDQQSRVRRLKKVGFWTLSLAVHALFMGMAGNVI
ncbi:mitochondrial distribution and morphology protein [Colletotrichum tofieldiae]|uniref:Mitochondrial distribution and morphology protein n=1 Tax=Colletotrichum tofieldiae TaxID=708197 RepID=A0A166Q8T6_9PEZI|nr:mitochondrial distribution and morphology protein [Colletotrichum tofieldiae]GKT63590.1 mitochondrial distribution and morphology protein [Colletotrichum tofieldiae]GKT72400.1 mitochondrial distribution and morphology protein [Colletotrichum tofieldiae]